MSWHSCAARSSKRSTSSRCSVTRTFVIAPDGRPPRPRHSSRARSGPPPAVGQGVRDAHRPCSGSSRQWSGGTQDRGQQRTPPREWAMPPVERPPPSRRAPFGADRQASTRPAPDRPGPGACESPKADTRGQICTRGIGGIHSFTSDVIRGLGKPTADDPEFSRATAPEAHAPRGDPPRSDRRPSRPRRAEQPPPQARS